MTVGIVHLSDMHISKRNTILVENKGVIANTIYNNSVEYSNVIILVSGDTAFSGNAEEYALASELFTEIKNRFLETNKKVDFLICPGNHDCNFSKNTNFDGYFLVNNDGGITFELNGLKYKDVNLGIIANIRNK